MLRRISVALLLSYVFLGVYSQPIIGQAAPNGLHVLDSADFQRLQTARNPTYDFLSLQLNFLLFRAQPSLLDEQDAMQYFILMNNIPDFNATQRANQMMRSEFDYPKLAAFYKSKAPAILAATPSTIQVSVDPYVMMAHRQPNLSYQWVGSYDMTKGTFPFVDNRGNPATVMTDQVSAGNLYSGQNSHFTVVFNPVKFTEVRVSEDAARRLTLMGGMGAGNVGGGKTSRKVLYVFDVEVLADKPVISNNGFPQVQLNGKLVHINLQDDAKRPLASLYP